jgi:hypothetical protein
MKRKYDPEGGSHRKSNTKKAVSSSDKKYQLHNGGAGPVVCFIAFMDFFLT